MEVCSGASAELILEANRDLDSTIQRRAKKIAIQMELGTRMSSKAGSVNHSQFQASSTGAPRLVGLSPYFGPRTTPAAQPSITSLQNKNEKKKVDLLVAKLIYYEGLPINIIRSPHWQVIVDAICAITAGYKGSTCAEVQAFLVQDVKPEFLDRCIKF